MTESHASQQNSQRRRYPSLFWPIILIVSGGLLLLSNLGYLPPPSWNLLLRLWPVVLIALGIDVLIGRRTIVGAVVSGVLILILVGGVVVLVFFARNIPFLAEMARAPELEHERITYPLGEVTEATVRIDWSSLEGSLRALEDSEQLIEGEIDYYGDLIFDADDDGEVAEIRIESFSTTPVFNVGGRDDRRGAWEIGLSPEAELFLNLDSGSGAVTYDLTGLRVGELILDVGSGAVEVTLPATSSFVGEIDGGSGSLEIVLPDEVGLRIELEDGSGRFRTDERFLLVEGEADDDGVWETENYDEAEHRIDLEIDQGSGAVVIR